MADLLILTFHDPAMATRAQMLALTLQRRGVIGEGRVVQMQKTGGRVRMFTEPPGLSMRWGGVVDVWLALSRVAGQFAWRWMGTRAPLAEVDDYLRERQDDGWMHQVGADLHDNHAALILSVAHLHARPLAEAFADAGLRGQIRQSALSAEDEARLRVALMGQS